MPCPHGRRSGPLIGFAAALISSHAAAPRLPASSLPTTWPAALVASVEPGPAATPGTLRVRARGKVRSVVEFQLVVAAERDRSAEFTVVLSLPDGLRYGDFLPVIWACGRAGAPEVIIEQAGQRVPVKLAPPATRYAPAETERPEFRLFLFREGDRMTVYAFGHEKLPAHGPELTRVLRENRALIGEAFLVVRANADILCRDVLATYSACIDAGIDRVLFVAP